MLLDPMLCWGRRAVGPPPPDPVVWLGLSVLGGPRGVTQRLSPRGPLERGAPQAAEVESPGQGARGGLHMGSVHPCRAVLSGASPSAWSRALQRSRQKGRGRARWLKQPLSWRPAGPLRAIHCLSVCPVCGRRGSGPPESPAPHHSRWPSRLAGQPPGRWETPRLGTEAAPACPASSASAPSQRRSWEPRKPLAGLREERASEREVCAGRVCVQVCYTHARDTHTTDTPLTHTHILN